MRRLVIARTGLMVASGLLAGLARPAESSAIASRIDFGTTGSVGSVGITGAPVVRFEGMDDGHLTTESPFDLGRFVVAPLGPGTSTTYHFTPFDVSFAARSVDGIPTGGVAPTVLHGWLDGTVSGDVASKIRIVMVEQIPSEDSALPPYLIPPFRIGGLLTTLSEGPGGLGSLVSGSATPLEGVLRSDPLPSPAPEPTTIALFAGVAALGIARRGLRSFRRF